VKPERKKSTDVRRNNIKEITSRARGDERLTRKGTHRENGHRKGKGANPGGSERWAFWGRGFQAEWFVSKIGTWLITVSGRYIA